MRIIISPAKKMKVDTDSLPWRDLPQFLPEAETLCSVLQRMSHDERKRLWKCNDSIAALNTERLSCMDLRNWLTPAILSYEGIQYQYMAPGVFTEDAYEYVQTHLRILSGFYGLLRPFDGVTPYRLEMQAKLAVGQHRDLYAYWGDRLAMQLAEETDCIINLASKEYSLAVSRYLPSHVRFLTCVFGERINGKVVEKGTMCKMARGEMVRWMAQNRITDPVQIRAYDGLGYQLDETCSDSTTFVFIKQK